MKKLLAIVLVLVVANVVVAADAPGTAISAIPSLATNLVLYTPLDQTSGSFVPDASGNGNNGTLYYTNGSNGLGAATPAAGAWTTGKFGGALKFFNDGDKKMMSTHVLGANAYVNPWGDAQDWSFSMWVNRPTGRHTGWGTSYVNLWSTDESEATPVKGDSSSIGWHDWSEGLEYDHLHTRNDEWASTPYTGRNMNIGHSAGGCWDKNNLGTFNAQPDGWGSGDWNNIIVTVDGDPAGNGEGLRFDTKVYVNGVLRTQISETGWGWGYTPTEAISIGCSEWLKGIDMNDVVDDVGVWNRILTGAEITAITTPEPMTMSLLVLGGLALARRNRN